MRRFILFALLSLSACKPQEDDPVNIKKPKYLVEWYEGTTLKTIAIKINGRDIGRGDKAISELFEWIENVPKDSHLVFRCPFKVAMGLQQQSGNEFEPLPFERDDVRRGELTDLCGRKRLSYSVQLVEPKT